MKRSTNPNPVLWQWMFLAPDDGTGGGGKTDSDTSTDDGKNAGADDAKSKGSEGKSGTSETPAEQKPQEDASKTAGDKKPTDDSKAEKKFSQADFNEFAVKEKERIQKQIKDEQEAAQAKAADEARKKALKDAGEHQKLYETEQQEHQKTQAALAAEQVTSNRLRLALELGLTERQAMRLQGNTLEELRADAEDFVSMLKRDDDKAGDKKEDPPPTTEAGAGGRGSDRDEKLSGDTDSESKPVVPQYAFQKAGDKSW